MSKTKIYTITVVLTALLVGTVSYATYDPKAKLEASYEATLGELKEGQVREQSLSLQLEAQRKENQGKAILACEVRKEIAKLKGAEEFRKKTPDSKELNRLQEIVDFDCTKFKVNLIPQVYEKPSDLFYTFLKWDGGYTTQTVREHFSRNGYIATDLGTGNKKLAVYAPSYQPTKDTDEERTYTVKIVKNYSTMGLSIELHWKEGEVDYSWALGHMNQVYVKDGDIVKTGDKIGLSGGCVGELQYDEKSTGCHLHAEFRIDGKATPYPTWAYTIHYGEDGKPEVKENLSVDIDKLAHAVAMAETGDCTKGYGKTYNNCFGIKNGTKVPCEMGTTRTCKFATKEESYAAFKKIWIEGYNGEFPDIEAAKIWTGNNTPEQWLENVKHYYNS